MIFIEITDKELLDIGFEKLVKDNGYYRGTYICASDGELFRIDISDHEYEYIYFDGKGYYYAILSTDRMEDDHIEIKGTSKKYIHEIVNIFHSIYGKELKKNMWDNLKVLIDGKEITGIKTINYVPKKD